MFPGKRAKIAPPCSRVSLPGLVFQFVVSTRTGLMPISVLAVIHSFTVLSGAERTLLPSGVGNDHE